MNYKHPDDMGRWETYKALERTGKNYLRTKWIKSGRNREYLAAQIYQSYEGEYEAYLQARYDNDVDCQIDEASYGRD